MSQARRKVKKNRYGIIIPCRPAPHARKNIYKKLENLARFCYSAPAGPNMEYKNGIG